MIVRREDDMFTSGAECLVNTVNCMGTSGKGIALEFKRRWPRHNLTYTQMCRNGAMKPGGVLWLMVHDETAPALRRIAYFATKDDWRANSQLDWVKKGLEQLVAFVRDDEILSIAIPALGCGNGGLDWADVFPLIEQAFADLPNVTVYAYAPK